jgi:hypothetical protein
MPKNSTFIFAKECQTIIKNNSPEKSIDLIANIKSSVTGKKVGKEKALQIYILYSEDSVKYTQKEYGNNIYKYVKKVDSNVKKASKHISI